MEVTPMSIIIIYHILHGSAVKGRVDLHKICR